MAVGNIDWKRYGALVKGERVKQCIRSTEAFSEEIWLRTREKVSKDVLYRIEQGRQAPTATQFMAINLTLFYELWPDGFEASLMPCLSEEWGIFVKSGFPPYDWTLEDVIEAIEEHGIMTDGGDIAVDQLDLPGQSEDCDAALTWLSEDEEFEVFSDGELLGVAFAEVADYGRGRAVVYRT